MDPLGSSEVSSKIRQAIKAKLIELGAYVDDELPDYIMVMVANQKTEPQMREDLGLFLSENTDVFVTWLVQVLDKLKKVTIGDGEKKAKKKVVKKKTKVPKKDAVGGDGKEGKKKRKKKVSPTKKAGVKKKTKNKVCDLSKPKEEEGGEENLGATNNSIDDDLDKKVAEAVPTKVVKGTSVPEEANPSHSPAPASSHSPVKPQTPPTKEQRRQKKKKSAPPPPPPPSIPPAASASRSRSHSPRARSRSPQQHQHQRQQPDLGRASPGPTDQRRRRNATEDDRDRSRSGRRRPSSRGRSRSRSNDNCRRARPLPTGRPRLNSDRDRSRDRDKNRDSDSDRNRSREHRFNNGGQDRRADLAESRQDRELNKGKQQPQDRYRKDARDEDRRKPQAEDQNRSGGRRRLDSNRDSGSDGDDVGHPRSRLGQRADRPQQQRDDQQRRPPTVTSSIGAVISHDSDGEYDPEQMLKRSLVASQVRVTDRPTRKPYERASQSLVLRAVADADRSILSKQREERQKSDELAAIHAKRAHLSRALREGKLDERKISEINQKLQEPRGSRQDRDDDDDDESERRRQKKARTHSGKEDRHTSRRLSSSRMRSDTEQPARPHAEIERPRLNSDRGGGVADDSDDLRHRLGKRKEQEKQTKTNLELARHSGIRIRVQNDLQASSSSSKERPETESDRKRKQQQQPERADEEDLLLEEMRRRALESMKKGSRHSHPRPEPSAIRHLPKQRPLVSPEKKIIIPLNEDTSEDDTDQENVHRNTDSESSSSDSDSSDSDGSSSSDDDEEEESELSLSSEDEDLKQQRNRAGNSVAKSTNQRPDEKTARANRSRGGDKDEQDPQFIVTLDGINRKYFKERREGKQQQKQQQPQREKGRDDAIRPAQGKNEASKSVSPSRVKSIRDRPAEVVVKREKSPVKKQSPLVQSNPHSRPDVSTKAAPKSTPPPPPKKPEAKVAPVSRRAVAVTAPAANANVKQENAKPAAVAAKPKRARITAPEPDARDTSAADKALPLPLGRSLSTVSAPGVAAAATSSQVCRYWPNCSRGANCFYYHPSSASASSLNVSGTSSASSSSASVFKWTSASSLP